MVSRSSARWIAPGGGHRWRPCHRGARPRRSGPSARHRALPRRLRALRYDGGGAARGRRGGRSARRVPRHHDVGVPWPVGHRAASRSGRPPARSGRSRTAPTSSSSGVGTRPSLTPATSRSSRSPRRACSCPAAARTGTSSSSTSGGRPARERPTSFCMCARARTSRLLWALRALVKGVAIDPQIEAEAGRVPRDAHGTGRPHEAGALRRLPLRHGSRRRRGTVTTMPRPSWRWPGI